jgi:hypothetical protein
VRQIFKTFPVAAPAQTDGARPASEIGVELFVPRYFAADDECKIYGFPAVVVRLSAPRAGDDLFAFDAAPSDRVEPVLLLDRAIALRDDQRKAFRR